MPRQPSAIYQIKVTLKIIRPPIWRRILAPANITLLKLHDILQIVMGWDDSHLHQFIAGDVYYGNPEDDELGMIGTISERRTRLSEIAPNVGDKFEYEYDFGDGWVHVVEVEKILPPEASVSYPVCIKGKRACPPDDCGGPYAYPELLAALANPKHRDHDTALEWVGEDFDPEAFDLDAVNAALRSMGKGRSAQQDNLWLEEDAPFPTGLTPAAAGIRTAPGEVAALAETLPLHHDVLVLLSHIQTERPTGTQSSGNLPLKSVRAIGASLVQPPQMDLYDETGERYYSIHSEYDVFEVYYLHVLAWMGGLVRGGPGRRWVVTPLGEEFLRLPAHQQIWHLCTTWWLRVNWTIAVPFFPEEFLDIPALAGPLIEILLSFTPGMPTAFETFAKSYYLKIGGSQNDLKNKGVWESWRFFLQGAILKPQASFGILEIDQPPHDAAPTVLTVTPLGRVYLEELSRIFHKNRRSSIFIDKESGTWGMV